MVCHVLQVPFMLGTNANEGSIFIPAMPIVVPGTSFPPSDADIPKIVEHALDMYNSSLVDNITAIVMASYPPYNNNDNWERGSDLLTHYFFTCGARRTARALASQGVPTFTYQFSHKLSFLAGLEYDLLGDYHTSELFFVWANEYVSTSLTLMLYDRGHNHDANAGGRRSYMFSTKTIGLYRMP
jgi:carboxylesterase type B